ncbi:MAG: DUF3786 domain-containing protein [Nitrospirota bacterium]|nr:DUF3786 domain-containing protein [Nitrospirota bacterium]
MPPLKSPLDIYRRLPQTNCRDCGFPSCFAFATAVLKAERTVTSCPHLAREDAQQIIDLVEVLPDIDKIRSGIVEELRSRMKEVDLASSAGRLAGRFEAGKLIVRCLGRDFSVDAEGSVASECHTHSGLVIPLLGYVVHSKGTTPSGNWIPFRELAGANQRGPLFHRRAEQALAKLADDHAELFEDIITLFGGKRSTGDFGADVTVILYPLPKMPVLFCYWHADGDMESMLKIFFDSTAADHLPIESVFELGTGMVMMFEKIAQKHG